MANGRKNIRIRSDHIRPRRSVAAAEYVLRWARETLTISPPRRRESYFRLASGFSAGILTDTMEELRIRPSRFLWGGSGMGFPPTRT